MAGLSVQTVMTLVTVVIGVTAVSEFAPPPVVTGPSTELGLRDQAGDDAYGDTCASDGSGVGSVGPAGGVGSVDSASSGSTDTNESLAIWVDWNSGDGVGRAVFNSRYCGQIALEEKLFGGW